MVVKSPSSSSNTYLVGVVPRECRLPIPTKCDTCLNDITEIMSYQLFHFKIDNVFKEEYYCRKCLEHHFGFNKPFTWLDIVQEAIIPIYEKRIKPSKD